MLDEGSAPDMIETPDAPPPEEKSNRTFLIVGGIMAGLVFLTLVCMAVYFLVIAPRLNAQKTAAQATIEAENAQVVAQMTTTAEAELWTPTVPPTALPTATLSPVPVTPTKSPTPVIALNTATVTLTTDPATLVALQTQLSIQLTSTVVALATQTAQGMPKTGFFDNGGLPGLVVLAFALVVVIFLARRMRRNPTK